MSAKCLTRQDLVSMVQSWTDDPQGLQDSLPMMGGFIDGLCQAAATQVDVLRAAAFARASALVSLTVDPSAFTANFVDTQAIASELARLTAENIDLTPAQIAEHFFVHTVIEYHKAYMGEIDAEISKLMDE